MNLWNWPVKSFLMLSGHAFDPKILAFDRSGLELSPAVHRLQLLLQIAAQRHGAIAVPIPLVERLQQAAEKLTRENRLLVKVHRQLGEQLVSLMMVDMLRQREQWKAQWQEVGQLVTGIKARYAADRMAKWLLHWDRQMYKVVEAAYIFGLESLNENLQLPDSTKVELAFSQGALAFRPSIEELRSVYYREMKKFISIPNGFKGFGNANVYRAMASANTRSLVPARWLRT